MALIQINLDETPDKMEPIAIGIRVLKIEDIEEQEVDDGTIFLTTLSVDEPDAPDHERKGWERFNFKYAPARIKFKNMCKSAGHSGEGQGVEPSELINCHVKAEVAPRVYTDKEGNKQETTQVKRFLWTD